MTFKSKDKPQWFFAWVTGTPYITTECGWTRRQVISEINRGTGQSWKKTYRMGGRVIRCNITPKK